MLTINPPATAGGTDSVQERFQTFEAKPRRAGGLTKAWRECLCENDAPEKNESERVAYPHLQSKEERGRNPASRLKVFLQLTAVQATFSE